MELRKTSELVEIRIPKMRNPLEVMEHALQSIRNDNSEVSYATSFRFETDLVNEPVTLAMLDLGVRCLRVIPENKEDCYWEYLNLWADTYNMARMEDKHQKLDMPLGFLLNEFERYISGKTIWHNFQSFDKFLNL